MAQISTTNIDLIELNYGLWIVGLMAHIQFLVSFFAGGLAVPLIWYTFKECA
jgi:hypothetical protein